MFQPIRPRFARRWVESATFNQRIVGKPNQAAQKPYVTPIATATALALFRRHRLTDTENVLRPLSKKSNQTGSIIQTSPNTPTRTWFACTNLQINRTKWNICLNNAKCFDFLTLKIEKERIYNNNNKNNCCILKI